MNMPTKLFIDLFPHKMGEVGVAEAGGKLKALVGECAEFVGRGDLVLQDEAHHSAAACLGPYGLHLEASSPPRSPRQEGRLAHIEERMDNAHLAAHTRPIEEVFVLFGREVEEHAIIGLDAVD